MEIFRQFAWKNRKFSSICLEKSGFFVEKSKFFDPDSRPPRFQTRLTPLMCATQDRIAYPEEIRSRFALNSVLFSYSLGFLTVEIHSIFPDTSLAPLRVQYYSEVLLTTILIAYCVGVNMMKPYRQQRVKDLPKVPINGG